MDLVGPIIVFIIIIIIVSICGWCCKRKREGTVYGYGPGNVTVTTQPVPQQPYPVHGGPPPGVYGGTSYPPPSMPLPQAGYYPPPPMGYPPHGAYPPGPAPGGSPYQPPGGYPPHPGFQHQPPPYDIAVSQPPMHPPQPIHEGYGKQAPYNPSYQS
ncbi:protein lifeguard 1-like isoform X2 [Sitophilus oryzae]|uniref:Protein lifeguard 1-like isoform X2 n=1 Tax=Sitophilus oryzae TaxID=7048 RepID=A0A6J2YND0_SITOR|nr:protein lifeguard 1-like isoform X2 [Sitophilus oryzae]